MKYLNEYRDKEKVTLVANKINSCFHKQVRLMEVCGTHTTSIARYAIKNLLNPNVNLLSGPGCPVCVTSVGELEQAFQIAQHNVTVCTFGDMLKVPGKENSLSDFTNVKIVYSPLDAIEQATINPDQDIVFLGVGFETTTPIVGATILQAKHKRLKNFSVLSMHKLVPPALRALLTDNVAKIDGLICPGHVSTIIGAKAYEDIAKKYKIPCVITGFEPVDIVEGIYLLLNQLQLDKSRVEVQYTRAVNYEGNKRAQDIINEVFDVCDAKWRGIGTIPNSGLRIREDFAAFDARKRFDLMERDYPEPNNCLCGKILQGLATPEDCALFGKTCTPNSPIGPCMVSSEGSCAATYRYCR